MAKVVEVDTSLGWGDAKVGVVAGVLNWSVAAGVHVRARAAEATVGRWME